MLTASFYPRTGKRAPTVDIIEIVDGHRTAIATHIVDSKVGARKLAAALGAKCWNF